MPARAPSFSWIQKLSFLIFIALVCEASPGRSISSNELMKIHFQRSLEGIDLCQPLVVITHQ